MPLPKPEPRDEFIEKYRHVLRSICLDGFISRQGEDAEWKWRRIETCSNKIDNVLARIFEELTKSAPANGQPQQKGATKQ